MELTIAWDETGEGIRDIRFEGEGCAIALASTDLMAEALRGRDKTAALALVNQFQAMLRGEGELPLEFRKLNVMQGVSQFPVRIKCAALPWHTLKAALTNPSQPVTTEAP